MQEYAKLFILFMKRYRKIKENISSHFCPLILLSSLRGPVLLNCFRVQKLSQPATGHDHRATELDSLLQTQKSTCKPLRLLSNPIKRKQSTDKVKLERKIFDRIACPKEIAEDHCY